jgi:hypothetical protein
MIDFNAQQQKQIDQAKHVLTDDEVVLDVTTGLCKVMRMNRVTTRNGALLVTTKRVIFFTKKLGGYEMNDIVYHLLTSLDYKKGILLGEISFSASGDSYKIKSVPKSDVERVAQCIRGQMDSSKTQQQQNIVNNISDQLVQLSALHDKGIVNDAEYSAKKSELLSRM